MYAQVIVLNADYSFLNTVSWKKSFKLISKEKAKVVKWADQCIHTATGQVCKIPAVLKLIKFIRTIYRTRVPFSKKNVYIRDGYMCVYCGEKKIRLTLDHIVPKARGGKSTFENCVAACRECNNKKGDKLCREVKMFPKKKPYQPTISEFLHIKMKSMGIGKVIEEIFT